MVRPATRPAKPGYNWVSLLQFAGSGLGMAGFLGIGLSGLAYAILQPFITPDEISWDVLLMAAGGVWAGCLLIPSAVHSLAHLMGRPLPHYGLRGALPACTFFLLPLTILLGGWLLQMQLAPLLAPVHVLAASLSVAGLVWLGLRGLQLGGARLLWGSLASGLTAAPAISIALEAVVGLSLLLLGGLYVATNPHLMGQLPYIQSNLPHVHTSEDVLSLLADFLNDPVLLGLILVDLSLFTPLIEELFKPVALWLLVWRRPFTNAQGFAIGVLGGAGFALMENLFSAASTQEWVFTTSVRFGATAFHIATAGLMGWAIVRAKNEERYLGVFLIYAFNILLHGLWNGVVVFQSFAPQLIAGRELAAGLVLVGITLLSIAILIGMNARLQPPKTALASRPRRKTAK